MLKILLKKQFAEVFKGYFFDAKKNKMRSKGAIIAWFVFFVVIMVGVLGGIFTALALSLCRPLAGAGIGWLYFLIMTSIAIFLGAFGSIFNTYSTLYLSKDNDLLLSMPIPLRFIVTARLISVYLLGAMYAATVLIPMFIVYWIVVGATVWNVICGLLLFLIITMFVMVLSCLLGFVVAKISLRVKNKSFVSVLASLLFIGAYYFVYFKANDLINDILLNAVFYGKKIKGAAYVLYLFGRIGEGDGISALLFFVVTGAALFAICYVMLHSFVGIVTSSGKVARVKYSEKPIKEKSIFGALLGKEFARFTSSANYMLNCGLGVLLIPASGVLFLIKGRWIYGMMDQVLSDRPGSAVIVICTMICMLSAMNDMAAPSVSLEGKSLWIPQSLPVEPRVVLRAKMFVQLLLTGIPMLFVSVCVMIVLQISPVLRMLLGIMPLIYTVFSAVFDTVISVRMPLFSWTSEMVPIKQSGGILIALFGSWGMSVAFAGLYLLAGYQIGASAYLVIWSILYMAATIMLFYWLEHKGAKSFEAL